MRVAILLSYSNYGLSIKWKMYTVQILGAFHIQWFTLLPLKASDQKLSVILPYKIKIHLLQ